MPNLVYRLLSLGLILFSGLGSLHIRFFDKPFPNQFYWIVILFSGFIFILTGGGVLSKPLFDGFGRLKQLSRQWWQTFALVLLIILLTQSSLLFSRVWLVLWGLLTWVLLISQDLIYSHLIRHKLIQSYKQTSIAIIGENAASQRLIEYIAADNYSDYKIQTHLKRVDREQLQELSRLQLDEIWVCLTLDEAGQFKEILKNLSNSSAKIKFSPDLFMHRLLNHGISEVAGVPMIDISSSPFVGNRLYLKNIEDFFLSLVFCILFSPVFITLAALVKLNSPGPIFYRQLRVGLNGKPFEMLKFRSMPVDIEKAGVQWGGAQNKVVDSFSAFLRKYNLDELPQFFNVLRGQMSIVGPRPERIEFIEQFANEIPNYAKKHLVKAGITGWAQIHGLRGDTDLNQRIEYDLFYIENWSLALDLKIILLTAIEPFSRNRRHV
ncbi:exopolysaccharide biosynthesis polyprenyl glycosylphosphotransferase [Polynucleobacter sp. MWH-Svant-W18]|uniref:exopolysaccharide biosynthesis polyprenyl glycosylphosphotransferase n=1 Tax=Polynucleobacter sp. MWH-Svant-W18 TaxID=1855909 RepID=UPI001BFDC253|nr:exopolysaccharide biosynthesis polyprenyl glycosylphosphotransferase [Polynucleobacter sp. MWH-Svant-W18]QWD78276.1 exopolysaccharide biosynthesis polyprenyl glycosylphosphotransferase [Polynucleobacter sp. MWH-Svant-W18]